MKKFLLLFLLSTGVLAQGDPPPYVKGQSASGLGNLGSTIQVPKNQSTKLNSYQARIETGNTNELRNPSFEGSPYNSGWVCPTGTISQAVGPDGFKALGIVSSGSGFECNQTFTSTADLKGTLARFFARVKTSAPNTFVCGLDGGSSAGNRVNCQKVSLTTADKVFSETSGFFNYGNMVYGIAIYSTDTAAFPTVIDEVSMGAAGLTTVNFQSETGWVPCTFSTLSWQGLGTVTNDLRCKRSGEDLSIRGSIVTSGVSANQARIPLPSNWGAITSSSKINANEVNGDLFRSQANTNVYLKAIIQPSVNYFNISAQIITSANNPSVPVNGDVPLGNERVFIPLVTIPIAEWSAVNTTGILSSNADTNWTNFTPTGGWTTNTTYTGKFKYVGDSAVIQLKVATSGAPGGNTALSMDMPAFIGVIDTAKLVGTTLVTTSGNTIDTGSAIYDARATAASSTIVTFNANASSVAKTYPMTWTSGDSLEITFTVPIVGRTQSPIAIIPLAGVSTIPGYTGTSEQFSIAYYGANAGTNCTSGTCSNTQDGTGASVAVASTNQYTLTAPRTYSKLFCSLNTMSAGAIDSVIQAAPLLFCANCSTLIWSTFRRDTAAAASTIGLLRCTGTY